VTVEARSSVAQQFSMVASAVTENRDGGIFLFGNADALFVDTTFARNRRSAALDVFIDSGSLTVERCTFDRNQTPGEGAGIQASFSGPTTVTVSESTFSRNRAARGAGAVFASSFGAGTVSITNSVFRGNRAHRSSGGGLWVFGTLGSSIQLDLIGSTIVHNGGGGLRVGNFDIAPTTAHVTDTILFRNGGGVDVDLRLEQAGGPLTVDADHNIVVRRGGTGTFNDLGGNLAVDPLLTSRVDVHLRAGSPAIDAGTCAGAPATDFEGDPRPTGAGCDIGADERVP
jgi:hypothetical protein